MSSAIPFFLCLFYCIFVGTEVKHTIRLVARVLPASSAVRFAARNTVCLSESRMIQAEGVVVSVVGSIGAQLIRWK